MICKARNNYNALLQKMIYKIINTYYTKLNKGVNGTTNQTVQDRKERAGEHAPAQVSKTNASDTGVILTYL